MRCYAGAAPIAATGDHGRRVTWITPESLPRDSPLIIFTRMNASGNTTVTLGLVQLRCSTDPAENLEKAIAGVREAAGKGAQIVCLQELFRSQYFCQTEDHRYFELAEPIPGPSTERSRQAGRRSSASSSSPPCSRSAPRASITTPRRSSTPTARYLGKYRKMHIPDDPQYYEKFYFTPGDLGFRAWDTRFGRIGVLVCWDQWYPEAARLTALQRRPDPVLSHRHRLAAGRRRRSTARSSSRAWETIQRSHAIANGVYVCAVNRVGHEGDPAGGIEFWGGSFVADPGGRVLVQGRDGRGGAHRAAATSRKVDVQRTHWPFLRDRRIDAYADITGGIWIDSVTGEPRSEVGIDSYRLRIAQAAPCPPADSGLPHARRVGAAPRHLAQLAAQGGLLARQVRAGAGHLRARWCGCSPTGEEVHINVAGPGDGGRRSAPLLTDEGADTGNVFFHHIPTNDAWCRDHGPDLRAAADGTARREQAIVDWGYNAWGGKYPPYDLDDVIPTRIGEELGIPVFHPGIVLEGGSIDVNGARHAAHHRGLPAQSEPQPAALDASEIEQYLRGLPRRAATSSGWVTASRATTPTVTWTTSPASSTRRPSSRWSRTIPPTTNYEPLQENLERLARHDRTRTAGRSRVVTLPMPRAARITRASACRRATPTSTSPTRVVLLPTYDPAPRRARRRRHAAAALPDPATSSGSTAPTWCGDWAPSTASPSSGR